MQARLGLCIRATCPVGGGEWVYAGSAFARWMDTRLPQPDHAQYVASRCGIGFCRDVWGVRPLCLPLAIYLGHSSAQVGVAAWTGLAGFAGAGKPGYRCAAGQGFGHFRVRQRKSRLMQDQAAFQLVPRRGLEPPRSYPLVPETSASTNSATWAGTFSASDCLHTLKFVRQSSAKN